MENQLAKIEKLSFHTGELFCPVIENEPLIIMNLIIKNIGLNYDNHIGDLQKSRFAKWTHSFQLVKEEKNEIQPTIRQVKIQNKDEKPYFYEIQLALWQVIFEEIGGYEYTVLPIRKLAGWLYSINPNKVKPEVKEKLELYQDECDEILYQDFFGPVSKRKIVLVERTDIQMRINAIEKELKSLPLYQEYTNLLNESKRLSKILREIDIDVINAQKSLFESKEQIIV